MKRCMRSPDLNLENTKVGLSSLLKIFMIYVRLVKGGILNLLTHLDLLVLFLPNLTTMFGYNCMRSVQHMSMFVLIVMTS